MNLVHTDSVFQVAKGTAPDYDRGNSLVQLMKLMQKTRLAAGRENYLAHSLQYLFPFKFLELYGPAGDDFDQPDPTKQDNKLDFQKQNVRRFHTTDTYLVRGLVSVGDWTGPFLRVSYRGGVDSKLSAASGHTLGDRIKLWLKVGASATPQYVTVPYNPESDRYEVEFWGYPAAGLLSQLDELGRASFDRGELLVRTDLIHGDISKFDRGGLNEVRIVNYETANTMHPVLPLHVELAWTDLSEKFWDSQDGANYQYEFNMILRGWDSYLETGISPNPHGGVGFLEYRNLMSNYGGKAGRDELGRTLEPWNFDAFGKKDHGGVAEKFMAVDYMDLHILKGNCGIGLHRHRDNQEIFLMMEGTAFMVVGDWCEMPERERTFEVRTLLPGHFAMLKGGNLHGLMNATDEDISLFMFGGYD